MDIVGEYLTKIQNQESIFPMDSIDNGNQDEIDFKLLHNTKSNNKRIYRFNLNKRDLDI